MNNNIEQIINELEDYIDSCKYSPLSTTKILVNKEEIEELLGELKMKTPDEIRKYKRMLANKNGILDDAKQKAENIITEATEQASALVNEHEIMRQAYIQGEDLITQANAEAQRIIAEANAQAEEIQLNAIRYTDELLANIQNTIAYSMDTIATRYEGYMKSLQNTLETVVSNRNELNVPQPPAQQSVPQQSVSHSAAVSQEQTYEEDEIDDDFEDYKVEIEDMDE